MKIKEVNGMTYVRRWGKWYWLNVAILYPIMTLAEEALEEKE